MASHVTLSPGGMGLNTHHLSIEARPRFWKLFACSVPLVAAALALGLWLSGRLHEDSGVQAQHQRTEEVVAQDRLLVDALWSAIETVKTRALSLEQVRSAQARAGQNQVTAQPDGPILHWAELELKNGKLAGVRGSARNPMFQPGAGIEAFENFYLHAALSRLNLHELQENGVTILRIKQDSGRSLEWLALAFAGGESSVVVALVDPAEVFPIFRRWTSRSEGGNLRGYLVGSDGFIIAHSQHPYVASDFSATQVFAQGVQEMIRGRIRNGAGVYKAIDQVPVTAAFARPGTLPLGAVVERVNPKEEPQSLLAALWFALTTRPEAILQALVGGVALALAAALAMSAYLSRSRKIAAEAIASPFVEEEIQIAQEEIESPAQTPFSPFTAITESDQVENEFVEAFFSEQAQAPLAQVQQSERVEVAKFETEVQLVRDPKLVAQSLAETAAKLTGAPALFFSYHDNLKACLLKAHAGLPPGVSTDALSFRLTDSMLGRIARYRKEGRTASLSDDPNLALLMAKRLGGAGFEAWPVSGQGGKLLGVLAVLASGSAAPVHSERLDQLMKTSGSIYERLPEHSKST